MVSDHPWACPRIPGLANQRRTQSSEIIARRNARPLAGRNEPVEINPPTVAAREPDFQAKAARSRRDEGFNDDWFEGNTIMSGPDESRKPKRGQPDGSTDGSKYRQYLISLILLINIIASGGEGGIRTLGRALRPYDGLANRWFKPLTHLSHQVNQWVTPSIGPEGAGFGIGWPTSVAGAPCKRQPAM